MLTNARKHFILVTKHRWLVFKLSIKAGIPWLGFIHDLSKYSPTEFIESVKYFRGGKSPYYYALKDKGYALGWIHHQGRNKHHHEYWYDYAAPTKNPVIPYKYTVEMICDKIAASTIYQNSNVYEYWKYEKQYIQINEDIKKVVEDVLKKYSKEGDKVINKKYLKKVYYKYVSEEAK